MYTRTHAHTRAHTHTHTHTKKKKKKKKTKKVYILFAAVSILLRELALHPLKSHKTKLSYLQADQTQDNARHAIHTIKTAT